MFRKLLEFQKKKLEEKSIKTKPEINKDFMVFDSFKPLLIEDNSDSFSESLGISHERAEVLMEIIDSKRNESNFADWVVQSVNEAVHPNEVCFIAYKIGHQVGFNTKIHKVIKGLNDET